MDFSYSETQQEVQNLARKILEDLVTNDRLKEVEATDEVFDRALWKELAKANMLGLGVAEAYGGSGMDYQTVCILLEEIGRTVAPVPATATLVLGALPVERFGNHGVVVQRGARFHAGQRDIVVHLGLMLEHHHGHQVAGGP